MMNGADILKVCLLTGILTFAIRMLWLGIIQWP
jgi:hypothetical protein